MEYPNQPRSARRLHLALLLSTLLVATACGGSRDEAEERAHRAERSTGEILIGAAWPWEARKEMLYQQGMDLALSQVNAAGGVDGRALRIVRRDDNESVNDGRMVAQAFAENPDIVAVIGHLQSYVSVPAAAIYDLAGLVMIAPTSTDPELTRRDYDRVFRGIFTDRETGRQMARYAADRGFRRVALYYVRNEYGRSLANAFEEQAAGLRLSVVARHSYDAAGEHNTAEIEQIVQEWKQLQFDAIFLAGEVPQAAHFIVAARRHGIAVPILGGDAVGTPELLSVGGEAAEGTIVATAFHPDDPRPEVQRFVVDFEQRYGKRPDVAGALGYDAVRLLAHAMRQAGTPAPDRVAQALRDLRGWQGVTGSFTFDANGDPVDKRVTRTVVRDGRFEFLHDPASAAGGPLLTSMR